MPTQWRGLTQAVNLAAEDRIGGDEIDFACRCGNQLLWVDHRLASCEIVLRTRACFALSRRQILPHIIGLLQRQTGENIAAIGCGNRNYLAEIITTIGQQRIVLNHISVLTIPVQIDDRPRATGLERRRLGRGSQGVDLGVCQGTIEDCDFIDRSPEAIKRGDSAAAQRQSHRR